MPAAQRREQLLDVAKAMAEERGFHAVSIDAVARGAGITRPVVYAQFGDLEGLLHALVDREESAAQAQLSAVIPDAPGEREPDELVLTGLRRFLEAVQANPATWRLVLLSPEGAPPLLRQRVERGRAAALEQIERLVAWGLERRGGLDGLDAELFARLLQTVGEDAARLVLTDPGRYPPERLARFAATMLAALERGTAGAR
jgi:AcrR family transcriptional regulator